MKIYIAKDYEGQPTALVLADSKDKAEIFFMGAQLEMHSVEEIDPATPSGINGLAVILTSTVVTKHDIDRKSREYFVRKFKRGM